MQTPFTDADTVDLPVLAKQVRFLDECGVHGVVWPLYGSEDTAADAESGPDETPVDEISALLKEVGIADIRTLPDRHFPEFCEDCGAPLFPDANGDFVHATLPEGGDTAPASSKCPSLCRLVAR